MAYTTRRECCPLDQVETWIFDLDNTLYPASCRLFDQVQRRMTEFICDRLEVNTTNSPHSIGVPSKPGCSITGAEAPVRGLILKMSGLSPAVTVYRISPASVHERPSSPVCMLRVSCRGEAPVAELIQQVGITEQTLYRWKKQYKGLETDQVRQFKPLQDENGRLKRLVAELTLDKTMLQDVLSKKL